MRVFVVLLSALIGLPWSARAEDAPASMRATEARLRRLIRGEYYYAQTASVPYAAQTRRAARANGIPPSLLAGLFRAESNWDPKAISAKGAVGLGQLMPGTAAALGVRNPLDPIDNLNASARYLGAQLRRFGEVRRALAAYHGGPSYGRRDPGALPAETRIYVRRVLRFEQEYRRQGLP